MGPDIRTVWRVGVGLSVIVAATFGIAGCDDTHSRTESSDKTASTASSVVADKPFMSGGRITIDLDGGGYEVRAASDNRIRVSIGGNAGNARVEVTSEGERGDVKVKDTPHNNFKATIEVPKTADLTIHLSGGELVVGAIAGNKDVEAMGGNINIAVGNPDDYASVDASVKAGDLSATPFGGSKSGLMQHFTWSGKGKYTLRASLGAGNLSLRGE
jgi:hypothetical protein